MVIELPPGYYLTNFIELVDYVVAQYHDLLSESEQAFHQQFHSVDESAQKLYVRMLTRKGNVFRHSKLQYSEIADTAVAAQALADAGLIRINHGLAIADVLALFTKPEWLGMLAQLDIDAKVLKPLKSLKRVDLDVALLALADEYPITALITSLITSGKDEAIYANADSQSFETFKLLFFGNLHQDLTEFVLRDLGLYRFEDYQIDRASRLFDGRAQIANHLHYYALIENLATILEQGGEEILALHQSLPDATALIEDKTLNRRIQRVNLTLARQLERLDLLDEALMLYQCCELPPARERTARILLKQQKVDAALAICREIMAAPLGDEELVFGAEFGARAAKKHKQQWPALDKYQPPTETITLEPSGLGVEPDTARYLSSFDEGSYEGSYEGNGECYFVENALFGSLFGLHFWSVLFAPVKGAFTNPFQFRPHDLYSREFLTHRQDLFDEAMSQLDKLNDQSEHYIERWQEKFGIATPFVHWDILDEALITKALARIPLAHWQAIFQRLWADLRANRSGFPDLILFPEAGGYELVEVKGPGDKLQKNQLRWMQYFHRHDIPHRVIHVKWSEVI